MIDVIENSTSQYKRLFRILPYGAVLFDATLSIQEVNPAATRILGLTEKQFDRRVGSPDWQFTDINRRVLQFHELPLSQVFATGKPVRNFTVGAYNPKAKKQVWLRGDVLPLQKGRQRQYWAIFQDVTEEYEKDAASYDRDMAPCIASKIAAELGPE
jgi:PAS domain S-box-containing protein